MRKILCFFAAVLLIFSLSVTAFAAEAPSASATATVNADGSAHVALAVTLRLDGSQDKIYFPLPTGATGIRVNGRRVSATKENEALQINLRRFVKNVTGDVSVNIQYDLHGLVAETEAGLLQLQLPLLSGFVYPISELQFAVTLPGAVNTLPAFASGYHQNAIEQHLSYEVEGNTIRGRSLKAMKDHETLTMSLVVDDVMFPRVVVQTESTLTAWIGIIVCAALGLIYWLIWLRFMPLRKQCSEVPYGFNAGQMGCILGSGGVDLTMMVFTWAQLGYVLIQPDKRGHVLIHKRMEMGNERSDMEVRNFRNLFGNRQMVDATGSRYAELATHLQSKPAGIGELMNKRSGNPKIFRIFLSGVGLFAGGGIGAVLGSGAALQWFLIILLSALGGFTGYLILGWTDSGLLHDRRAMYRGLGLAFGWILLGLVAGVAPLGLALGLGLAFFGILYGWGGLRTDFGKRTAGQLAGLKHYLRGGDKQQLNHACNNDPDYFFRMAPYAIALGVGHAFAKAVGPERLDKGPYLTLGADGQKNAAAWLETMVDVANAMDSRKRSRHLENLLRFISTIIKH